VSERFTQISASTGREYSMRSKYDDDTGTVFMTGTQAMVRVMLNQLRHDATRGRNTAAFVSGYPGSPLGGLDLELARQKTTIEAAGLHHLPGHNEELAATAVWGTQAAQTFDDALYDGVTGYWYGKGPGLDRASDAIRHAQYVGTAPHGGVVAFVGDDPASKSSSIPNTSEQALQDLGLPTMMPRDVADILNLGQHAVALSRASGLWTAIRIVTSIADGTMSVTLNPEADRIHLPELEWRGKRFVPTLAAIPGPPWSLDVEAEILGPRQQLAREYGYLNQLNRVEVQSASDWMGIAAVGHQYGEVTTALAKLGIGTEDLSELGIRILSIRQPHPLDERTVREFASGLEEILVVEDKRAFVERMIRETLYGSTHRPHVVGKTDEHGRTLLPSSGALDVDILAPTLRARLVRRVAEDRLQSPPPPRRLLPIIATRRAPYFCSGCPHNTSTRVPEGAVVGGGIGCHGMSQFMEPEITGGITSTTHMGSEGAQWIGIAPFVETDHMFQNVGDGTYFHSGQLAVQAAIAAGSHITYKLLFNDAIAMTGGQEPSESNALSVPQVCEVLLAQGVGRIIVTTEDTSRYRDVEMPRQVKVWDRSRILEAQEKLAATPGVTVLIHDQRCAAENRRDRKRGILPAPRKRVVINERVCEGCGDCGLKSNCLSVEPVDTEFGRKTQINQDSCNLDFSCLQGDCPSFLTVTVPERRTVKSRRGDAALSEFLSEAIPIPNIPRPGDGFIVRMPGIGGTGVVTASQILGTAAMLDGHHVLGLDQTGLSQKAGPVVSDLTITDAPTPASNKATASTVDLLLGLDILGSGTELNLASIQPGRTHAIVSTARTPTGRMVSNVSTEWPETHTFERGLEDTLGPERVHWVDAERSTRHLFGSTAGVNLFMVGVAFQFGSLPITAQSLERAIALNGTAVEMNIRAFRAGRWWALDRNSLMSVVQDPSPEKRQLPNARKFAGLLKTGPAAREVAHSRAAELADYQNDQYARRFIDVINQVAAAESAAIEGSETFATATINGLFKLMAYKDEYEVARLSLDRGLKQDIRAQFGAGAKVRWQLHPPLLRTLGLKRKLSLGVWFTPVFWLLYQMRWVRGTRLDVFGYSVVRRTERQLIEEYIECVTDVSQRLTAAAVPIAAEIAALPDAVRGYEAIKIRNVESYRAAMAKALERFDEIVAEDVEVDH
jgi:indolepyruvate ferredoxin oxidoreductase